MSRQSRCKKCKRVVVKRLFTPSQFVAHNKWPPDADHQKLMEAHRTYLAQIHPNMVECVKCDSMVEWA